MILARRALGLVGIFVLLLLVLIVFAPFTGVGNRAIFGVVNSVSPVQVQYRSGTFFSGIQLASITLVSDSFTLVVNDVDTTLDFACLWRSTICLSRLKAAGVAVNWEGGQWRNEEFTARVSLNQFQIAISDLTLANSYLEIQTQSDKQSSSEMPTVSLPFELLLDEVQLHNVKWKINGVEYVHENIVLEGQWRDTVLTLGRVELRNEQLGVLSLFGQLQLAQQWPFEVAADARWNTAFDPSELLGLPTELAGITMHSPWSLLARGTLRDQIFSLRGAFSGLGYEDLRLEISGQHNIGLQRSTLVLKTFDLIDAHSDSDLKIVADLHYGNTTEANFTARSNGLSLPELNETITGRLAGSVQGSATIQSSNWGFALKYVDINGEVGGLPASVKGQVGVDSAFHVTNSDLVAQVNGATLRLSDGRDSAGQALLALRVDDIGRWLSSSSGSLELKATLSREIDKVQLTGALADFRWQDTLVERGVITGVAELSEVFPFQLSVDNFGVSFGDVSFQNVQLSINGDKQQQAIELRSKGDITAQLGLQGTMSGEGWSGHVAPGKLDTPAGLWQLEKPMELNWDSNKSSLTAAAHCWQGTGASFCPGELRLLTSDGQVTVDTSVKIEGDSTIVEPFLADDIQVKSNFTMDMNVHWAADALPVLSGDILIGKGSIAKPFGLDELAHFSWDGAHMKFESGAKQIQIAAEVQKKGVELLGLKLHIPTDEEAALSGEMILQQLDLAVLKPFILTLSSLEGSIEGQIKLSGTPKRPLAVGELSLTDGTFSMDSMPADIDSLHLKLLLNGDKAEIHGGVLVGGGPLKIDGTMAYQPDFQVTLALVGENENLVFPPSVEATISHDIILVASPNSLHIAGDLTVHKGVLAHEELPEGGVELSDDVVQLSYSGHTQKQATPFDISMDVYIKIEDKFNIVGDIVDVTVGGDLQLQQERGLPLQLFGNLNVIGGQLEAYQQNLKVKRGTVSFSGAPENPALDMRAERVLSDDQITVGLQLGGTLDSPILGIYSDPAMSESESLSYLVRGRGLDSGAPDDGAALALSMGASLVNQSGVFRKFDKLPGINRVALSAEGTEGDTTATISGYIDQRIYLSYGVGLYEPINVLTARFYLNTRLWLEVVSSLENSMDLYYSFDIE